MTKDWEVLTEVQPTHTVQHITWRGDGAFFATCGYASQGAQTQGTQSQGTQSAEVCVWERTCALHSRSTLGSGESLLSGPRLISWRPSGQLIAALSPPLSSSSSSSSSSPISQRVVFFERNGLRHGEFNLRGSLTQGRVSQLGWSCDSEILSALVDGTIQLWNSSNYHWALKKEIFLRADNAKEKNDELLGFEWDPEDPHCLRAFSKGTALYYNYCYCDIYVIFRWCLF